MSRIIELFEAVIYSIKRISKRFQADNLTAYSAQAAFFIFISIFPFLMLLLSLLKYIPIFNNENMESWATDFLTPQVDDLIKSIFAEAGEYSSGAFISITTAAALWACSKGVLGIIYGLNSIYKTTENRSFIRLRIVAVIYTVGLVAAMTVVLILMVFGNGILNYFLTAVPETMYAAKAIRVIRWLVSFGILILFFLFLYSVIPDRKTKPKNELPGAVISAIGWIGFSVLYSFYLDNFGNQSKLYGSLTAIILFLLWIYICMIILFVGAEINDILRVHDFSHIMKHIKSSKKPRTIAKIKNK